MSLLFEVLNAITGSRTAPATHNMPRDCRTVMIHAANRAGRDRIYRFGLALLGADGDLGAVTVRKCIAELLERGWLEHAGWSGPRNAAVRCFLVRAEGGAWPVSTSHVRLSPPQRRAVAGRDAGPTPGDDATDAPPSSDDGSGHHAATGRADTDLDLGPTPGDDKPLRDPPIDPLNDPPRITSARTARDLGPAREGQLFGDLDPPGDPPKRRGRARRDPSEPKPPKAEDRYADAYERGHRDAGFPITALTPSEKKRLGPIAVTHARYRDDTPITGDALVQWFYRRARAFRRDVPDPSRHRGGASPFGFGAWLDNGADGEERPLAPGQEEEPPPSDDDLELRDDRAPPPEYTPSPAAVESELANLKRRYAQRDGAARG